MNRYGMVARLAAAAAIFFGLGQVFSARANSATAAPGSTRLTCAKYAYSLTIDSTWTVKDPCTLSTVIATDRGFGLGILLEGNTQLSVDSAKNTLNALVSGMDGFKTEGVSAFRTSTVGGRVWIRGSVRLKNADGSRYTLSDLETAYKGMIYHFVADIARPDNTAGAQASRIVASVWSSIRIGTVASTLSPMPSRPVPGNPSPAITAGTWEASNVSMIQYRDVVTGTNGPTNGAHIELDLARWALHLLRTAPGHLV